MPPTGDDTQVQNQIDWASAKPDRAYAEALRLISEAKAGGTEDFTLSNLPTLTRIPPEIASLTKVRKLGLYGLGVTGLEPLAGMSQLRELNINLPAADIGPLGHLHSLEVLQLTDMPVVNLLPLAQLQSLRILVLVDCDAATDIAPVAKLTGLTHLFLGGDGLRSLQRRKTGVTDLRPLAGLGKLIELDLKYSPVSDLAPIATLLRLQKLNLTNTNVVDLSPLQKLPALTDLLVSYTGVSDIAPLARLTSLKSLHLDETKVDDLGPVAEFIPMIDQFASHEGRDDDYDFDHDYDFIDEDDDYYDDRRGLHFDGTPVAAREPFYSLARIKSARIRTVQTINKVRLLKRLPAHYPHGYEAPAAPTEDESVESSLQQVGDYVRRQIEVERTKDTKRGKLYHIAGAFGHIGKSMLAAIGALAITIACILIKAYEATVHGWIDLYLFGWQPLHALVNLIVSTVPGTR